MEYSREHSKTGYLQREKKLGITVDESKTYDQRLDKIEAEQEKIEERIQKMDDDDSGGGLSIGGF